MKTFFKHTIIGFLLLISLLTNASPLDSLRLITIVRNPDTTLIIRLAKISEKYLVSNPDSVYAYLKIIQKLAQQHSLLRAQIIISKMQGYYFYLKGRGDSALFYFKKALKLCNDDFTFQKIQLYNLIGVSYKLVDKYDSALAYFERGLHLAKNYGFSKYIPYFLTNAANIYKFKGAITRAMDYNFNALAIIDSLGDEKFKSMKATIYNNIAILYSNQKKFYDSRKYYLKALELYKQVNNYQGIANVYLNLGVLYSDKSNRISKDSVKIILDSAIYYYRKALSLYKQDINKALALYNIGDSYNAQHEYDSAYSYLNKAFALYEKLGSIRGITQVLSSLGQYYYGKKNYNEALNYLLKAYKNLNFLDDLNIKKNITDWLSRVYAALGMYKQAYQMHVKFKNFNDSLFNKSNERRMAQLELSYKYEKEKRERELRFEAEMKRQELINKFSIAISLLLLLIIISVWRSLKIKKKANDTLRLKNAEILQQKEEIQAQRDEIEQQKEMIEKQAKELEIQRDIALKQKKNIEDSIHYALRIQEAVMPDLDFLKNYLKDYFIFFKPRDIVSGDFYWAAQRDNYLVITIADCTGHGVPGAFMSLLGITFLNEILATLNKPESHIILSMLRDKVIKSLKQTDSLIKTRDGMDMALVVIDTKNNIMQFSGAYNPLYYVKKKGQKAQYETNNPVSIIENSYNVLYEFKADKTPIGLGFSQNINFSVSTIKIEKGDKFYMFTDGFPSLFDYRTNRKYTTKRFKKLILDIASWPMDQQKEQLEKAFFKWIGKTKQIDDVLVGGFEI